MKFSFILFFILFCKVLAQTDSVFSDDILEIYTGSRSSEEEYSDEIINLYSNPVNINTATASELKQIPFLSENDISRIIIYRDSLGGFTNSEDFKNIPGVHSDITAIIPFIYISGPEKPVAAERKVQINLRNNLIYDNYRNEEYPYDNSYKVNHKLKINYGENIFISAQTEKDAGETDYADFSSFSLRANDLPLNGNVIIGDYSVKFGQGLALWSSYSPVKSTEAVSGIIKKGSNISPHTGSNENKFFRGIAANFDYGFMAFSLFYSDRKTDATLDDSGKITSLKTDGYHRTVNEAHKKNNIAETFYGFSADILPLENLHLGFLFGKTDLSRSFSEDSKYRHIPSSLPFYSVSYSCYYKNYSISGETAFNSGNKASINNLYVNVTKNIKFVTSFRYYDQDYFSYYWSPFGELYSSLTSETGVYSGIKINTGYGIINLYYDFYKIKNKYNQPFPVKGNEFLLGYSVSPFKNFAVKVSFKNKNKELNGLGDEFFASSKKYRFEIQYSPSKMLNLKSRYEIKTINSPDEKGELFFQDLRYDFAKTFRLNCRFIIFGTGSYNTALYEMENDLPGLFYSPPLYGEGLRWYINLSYKYGLFRISAKYSQTNLNGTFDSDENLKLLNKIRDRLSLQIELTPEF